MPIFAISAVAEGEVSSVITAITGGTTAVTGAFSEITGWWFVPVAVGFLVAGFAVALILKFFGKKRRSGRRR